jgi:trehalose 6-phosphate synthase/phosphatase
MVPFGSVLLVMHSVSRDCRQVYTVWAPLYRLNEDSCAGLTHGFGAVSMEGRTVRVDNFPMGVDAGQIDATLKKAAVQKEISRLKANLGGRDTKIILSVDRLDYSKGIPHRLKAVEAFLSKYPRWHKKIVFIMLCVPSRTKVRDYALLKQEVERLVGQINGRFCSPRWTPVSYMYRSLPFEKLLPLYAAADVALVTPVRDGMNLVAKEYVAARADDSGVLILSGTAGAVAEMGESLVVNVYNTDEIIESLAQALEMPKEEQRKRMKAMRKRIFAYDLHYWIRSFIEGIDDVIKLKSQRAYRELSGEWRKTLLKDYRGAQHRLLMLDYDGTLISFAKKPEDARPDVELKRLLLLLSRRHRNRLAIVSGRDRVTLERWLGDIPCILVAEHGAWVRWDRRSAWIAQTRAGTEWKSRLLPVLEDYVTRVPGSLIEEKEFGIAWHYRKANPELGEIRSHELFDNLNEFLANIDLQLMQGNKVLEVRPSGVNKGEAAQTILARGEYDFILALGDDWTDEDLFRVLPPEAYSVKIGFGATQARFFLESPKACREFLLNL